MPLKTTSIYTDSMNIDYNVFIIVHIYAGQEGSSIIVAYTNSFNIITIANASMDSQQLSQGWMILIL